MSRTIVRIGIEVGTALLALGALGMGPLSPIPPGDRVVGSVGLACFWSEQGLVCVERAIGLGATGLDPEVVLEALLAGPTAGERARGLRSAIPEGTALEGVEVGSSLASASGRGREDRRSLCDWCCQMNRWSGWTGWLSRRWSNR